MTHSLKNCAFVQTVWLVAWLAPEDEEMGVEETAVVEELLG